MTRNVYIADSSPVERRIVERLIAREEHLEVVGCTAIDAIDEGALGRADVVFVDPIGPGGGIAEEVLRGLARFAGGQPDRAMVVFTRAAIGSVERLVRIHSRGPLLVLPKDHGGRTEIEAFQETIGPWLRRLEPGEPPAPLPRTTPPRASAGDRAARPSSLARLIVIGASTGGPNAVAELLGRLPAGFHIPICIAQHMPAGFTRAFAARLDRSTAFEVRESEGGEPLRPGSVWIAPGDRHLEVALDGPRLVTRLSDAPPENSCRPAVDPLFRSAAALGPAALGVVLTGMGQDGLHGARALRAAGGQVLVQDQASSVVWGMPGAIARAGEADHVETIEALAQRLSRASFAHTCQRARSGNEGGRHEA